MMKLWALGNEQHDSNCFTDGQPQVNKSIPTFWQSLLHCVLFYSYSTGDRVESLGNLHLTRMQKLIFLLSTFDAQIWSAQNM